VAAGSSTEGSCAPRKCVVIGNGPSLRGFDLTRLSAIDTIGMNAAYRYWNRIGWYPTHYACLDDELIETHHAAIWEFMTQGLCETAFLTAQFLHHHPEAARDPKFVFLDEFIPYLWKHRGKHLGLTLRADEAAFRSARPDKLTTGSHAVRYAIWKGYTDVALVGVDLRYVELIPESSRGDGIALTMTSTPTHNPNYFFDDYQRAGDRFNIPNPDVHGGDLHVASFRTLRDDLVASRLPVRVVNSNPQSELARQGVLPFEDLDTFVGVRALGAVVVPTIASAKDQVVANLGYWSRPEASPMIWPREYKPDLVVSFNNPESAEALEAVVRSAYDANDLRRFFDALRFECLDLTGDADMYRTDYSEPPGPQGYKAGPNNQFFQTLRRVCDVGRYVLYMEPDCVPIRPDWLGQLIDQVEHAHAWIIGSVYRGRGALARRWMRHLNGNAVYAVGDSDFQDFVCDLERRLSELVAFDPRVAYDLALEVLFGGASCHGSASDEQRVLWHYYQALAHRFHATDYVQNIGTRLDVEHLDPDLADKVRASSPRTYLVHNSALARRLTA
jgi:hypothetical protein